MPYLLGRVSRINAKSAFVTLPRTADLGLPKADGLLRASKDKLDELERGQEVKVSVVRIDDVRGAGGKTTKRAILRFATQCFFCKHFGHSRRDCRQLIAAQEALNAGKGHLSRNQRRKAAGKVDLVEAQAQRSAKSKGERKAPAAPLMSAFFGNMNSSAAAAPTVAGPVSATKRDTCLDTENLEAFPALPAKAVITVHVEHEADAISEAEFETDFVTEIEVEEPVAAAWCPLDTVAEVALAPSSPVSTISNGSSAKRKRLSKKRRERARRQQASEKVIESVEPPALQVGLVEQIHQAKLDAQAAQNRLSALLEQAQLVTSQSA